LSIALLLCRNRMTIDFNWEGRFKRLIEQARSPVSKAAVSLANTLCHFDNQGRKQKKLQQGND